MEKEEEEEGGEGQYLPCRELPLCPPYASPVLGGLQG